MTRNSSSPCNIMKQWALMGSNCELPQHRRPISVRGMSARSNHRTANFGRPADRDRQGRTFLQQGYWFLRPLHRREAVGPPIYLAKQILTSQRRRPINFIAPLDRNLVLAHVHVGLAVCLSGQITDPSRLQREHNRVASFSSQADMPSFKATWVSSRVAALGFPVRRPFGNGYEN